MEIRLQSPDGASTVVLPTSGTLADLRAKIAEKHSIPASEQTLLSSFPPQPIASPDSARLVDVLGAHGARVLVRRTGPPAAGGGGGGRRKPAKVQRLPTNAEPPRDAAPQLPPPAPAPEGREAAQPSASAEPAAVAGGGGAAGSANSGSGGGGKKRKAPAEPDPLALTLQSEAARQKLEGGGSGGGGGAGASAAATSASKMKGKTADAIASEYYTSSGSAVSAAARGGGKTGDFLSEHGMIEHRTSAVSSRKYELEAHPPAGKGKSACATLSASFKAVRKQVCETVQLLSRDELKAFLAALAARGSSRRGASNSHLLKLEAMAARSPTVLGSMVHCFDGDVAGGIEELQTELAIAASAALTAASE
jgi:hypothetical protein